jgi:glycogen synthase
MTMHETISILILGRHAGMMQNVIALLAHHGFVHTKGVLTNDEVLDELATKRYTLLIIGGGVDLSTRQEIREFVARNGTGTGLLEHYGNPVSLIEEIRAKINS